MDQSMYEFRLLLRPIQFYGPLIFSLIITLFVLSVIRNFLQICLIRDVFKKQDFAEFLQYF